MRLAQPSITIRTVGDSNQYRPGRPGPVYEIWGIDLLPGLPWSKKTAARQRLEGCGEQMHGDREIVGAWPPSIARQQFRVGTAASTAGYRTTRQPAPSYVL